MVGMKNASCAPFPVFRVIIKLIVKCLSSDGTNQCEYFNPAKNNLGNSSIYSENLFKIAQ